MAKREEVECPSCHRRTIPIYANLLHIGKHRTESGKLLINAVVVDTCKECRADLTPRSYTIETPLTHDCPTGQQVIWEIPIVTKVGLRPEVGWELTVTAYCQFCRKSETAVWDWVIEGVPSWITPL